jgi:hypothetical protein
MSSMLVPLSCHIGSDSAVNHAKNTYAKKIHGSVIAEKIYIRHQYYHVLLSFASPSCTAVEITITHFC